MIDEFMSCIRFSATKEGLPADKEKNFIKAIELQFENIKNNMPEQPQKLNLNIEVLLKIYSKQQLNHGF